MNDYFNDMATAMDDTEKSKILKSISTELILNELKERLTELENRELSIKALFNGK